MNVLIIANYLFSSKCQGDKLAMWLGKGRIRNVWQRGKKGGKENTVESATACTEMYMKKKMTKMLCLCVGIKLTFDKCFRKENEKRKEIKNNDKRD